jgi:two-component system, NarL family, nitrate/nitrite response regulator NarL
MVVRVLVVDQQPLFSRGLELLLPAVSGDRVHVVAHTDAADAAAGLARRHQPDLALVDLGLPAPGGVRAIAAIRRVEPLLPVVAMTVADGGAGDEQARLQLAVDALHAGARSLLVKAQEPEDLLAPLLAAADGWAVLPQSVLDHLTGAATARSPRPADLTAAERRLWTFIAEGASTCEIAVALHVSDRTVKRLTATLLRRLGVSSRTEAATLAGRSGLLDKPA